VKTQTGKAADIKGGRLPLAESEACLDAYLELGSTLFKSGATTQRIIDSAAKAAEALGDPHKPQMMVSYDMIAVAREDESGRHVRMTPGSVFSGVDVTVLTGISKLLGKRNPGQASAQELRRSLAAIRRIAKPYSLILLTIAAIAASVAFDLLNGGDLLSLVSAIPAAIAVFLIRRALLGAGHNFHVATLLGALAGGLTASLAARLSSTSTPEIALIAALLFLVPGPAMINGGVDILRSHNAMGVARVAFTVALVSMITLGMALAMVVAPPPLAVAAMAKAAAKPWALHIVFDAALGALAAWGLGILNNTHRRILLAFAVCGAAARGGRAIGVELGMDVVSATLAGTTLSTIVSMRLSRITFAPSYVMAVVACLSMVPGLYAIEGLRGLFNIAASTAASPELVAATAQTLLKAILISASLVAGVIIPIMIVDKNSPRI